MFLKLCGKFSNFLASYVFIVRNGTLAIDFYF